MLQMESGGLATSVMTSPPSIRWDREPGSALVFSVAAASANPVRLGREIGESFVDFVRLVSKGVSAIALPIQSTIQSATSWSLTNEIVWKKVDHKFAVLEKIEENWDSYSANSPTARSIAEAKRVYTFVTSFPVIDDFLAHADFNVRPEPSGGVELEWTLSRGDSQAFSLFVNDDGNEKGYFRAGTTGTERLAKEGSAYSDMEILNLFAALLIDLE